MNMFFRFAAVCLLLNCLLSAVSATRSFNEEFEYRGKHTDPLHWSDLHKEWVACNNGHSQSPIELVDNETVSKELVPLRRHFNPGRATVTNRGPDIMVHWEEPAGGFFANGTEFLLVQLHWHKPSEHFVNGERFDVEMHMVHLSRENKFAVLTGLYRLGEPDPFLEQMKPFIEEVQAARNKKVDAGIVDPMDTGLDGSEYYRYMGSLTTPPCSEGVIWTVSKTFKTVSREQLHMLRSATPQFHKNARPVQLKENRVVELYHSV